MSELHISHIVSLAVLALAVGVPAAARGPGGSGDNDLHDHRPWLARAWGQRRPRDQRQRPGDRLFVSVEDGAD